MSCDERIPSVVGKERTCKRWYARGGAAPAVILLSLAVLCIQ